VSGASNWPTGKEEVTINIKKEKSKYNNQSSVTAAATNKRPCLRQ